MKTEKEVVSILGCGVLGEVMARGLLGPEGRKLFEVVPTHHRPEHAEELSSRLGVRCLTDNRLAVENATIVVLAVRPQSMADLLSEIRHSLRPATLCITIAAGLPVSFYEERLPPDVAFVRAHPSPMMAVRSGFIALAAGTRADARDIEKARKLFSLFCTDTLLIPERDMNHFAAMFGSSSALLYLFVDAVLSVENGDRAFSTRQVIASMLSGASEMLLKSSKPPRALSEEICTPNGMTVRGVNVWEEFQTSRIISSAMEAVLTRVREMAATIK
ncbi:MAG TPA: pyrroline-5-carboxylate reductase dimerization domain-containing protein [Blastocatellia bacterium]|nr:pyrroline-5-carboxylate reductase dimerization domain-containing protein [Blastocatellia bacterium]